MTNNINTWIRRWLLQMVCKLAAVFEHRPFGGTLLQTSCDTTELPNTAIKTQKFYHYQILRKTQSPIDPSYRFDPRLFGNLYFCNANAFYGPDSPTLFPYKGMHSPSDLINSIEVQLTVI